jgi:hypothetical protein
MNNNFCSSFFNRPWFENLGICDDALFSYLFFGLWNLGFGLHPKAG